MRELRIKNDKSIGFVDSYIVFNANLMEILE